ncbi:MAG: PAS domain-containing protein [Solidesulfovibrio sp.]
MARGIEANIATIAAQKTQLQAILDGMREGVMVLDAAGKVRVANPALARLAPIVGDPLGRRPIEVIPSPELQMACDRLLAPIRPPRRRKRGRGRDLEAIGPDRLLRGVAGASTRPGRGRDPVRCWSFTTCRRPAASPACAGTSPPTSHTSCARR